MDQSLTPDLVAVDIGGTHARFALATLAADGRPTLREPLVLKTAEYASLGSAWRAFRETVSGPFPNAASVCFAGPVRGERIKATNSSWIIQRSQLAADLGVDRAHLLNDFGAMAYAVAALKPQELELICGPDRSLSEDGVITVIGPGTGLGVALLVRRGQRVTVIETEGGHIDFAPLDAFESQIVNQLRERYLRVSTERVISGPGLAALVEAIAAIEQRPFTPRDDATLWQSALTGDDELTRTALDRFCLCYGAAAGDLALAHGASAVVLVGGLSQRLAERLRDGNFFERFCAKGRYRDAMQQLPVKLARYDQLGLLGAAAAFAALESR
ncbi:MAG: glucokinase [Pseudomonadota bacterium]